jgi:2-methylcitrate dehydratase PrpD
VGAAAAALGNAAALHALDYDDTHAGGLVHPTSVAAPVALAVAEEVHADGAAMLAAYLVGLEVAARLGAAAPHAFHARGLHATSVCGTVAAALVTARLLRLPAPAAAHAAGIAASSAGGLLEFLHGDATTKQLHPGLAAHAGIVAARLAAAGATGPPGALDGRYGLYAALAGRPPDRDALLGGLGERWEATGVTVKPYPACQLVHPALDAARVLRPRLTDRPAGSHDDLDGVAEVVVELHPDAVPIVCGPGRAAPRTGYEAKFALPWCVAAMLTGGRLDLASFDAPRPLPLAHRVRHEPVAFTGPAAHQPGRLAVRLRDGRRVTAEIPGGPAPAGPALDAAVAAKARANLGAGADRVRAAVDALPGAQSLHRLVAAVAAATEGGA